MINESQNFFSEIERKEKLLQDARENLKARGVFYPIFEGNMEETYEKILNYAMQENAVYFRLEKESRLAFNAKQSESQLPVKQWARPYYDD